MVAKLNDHHMPLLRPEPERDRFGRYVLPDPADSGEVRSFTRATTMAKAISDEYNLTQWKRRTIVEGLKLAPELLDQIDLMDDPRDVRKQIETVADEAHSATGADVARDRGTQLHYFTEAYDVGALTIAQIPDEYRNEIQAYAETMASAGITIPPDMVERIYINLAAGRIAGTADRGYVILPNGRRIVADVKTGKDLSYSWPEICMQLAIYANAEAIVEYDEQGFPTISAAPEVDKTIGLVMHLPVDQGKCTLHLIDLSAGWAAVELASEVREYRSRRNLAKLYGRNEHLPEGATAPTPLPVRYGDATVPPPSVGTAPVFKPVAEGPGYTMMPDQQVKAETVVHGQTFTLPSDQQIQPGMSVPDPAQAAADVAKSEGEHALDATLADIEALKASWAKGKRRTKAMIEADNAYDTFRDNDETADAQAYGIITRKLRRAYKLDDVPVTADPPKGPVTVTAQTGVTGEDLPATPDPWATAPSANGSFGGSDAAADEFALVKATEAAVNEAPPYVAELQQNDARNARVAEARANIDGLQDAIGMGLVWATFQDVWDESLQSYAEAKVAALTAPAPEPVATPETDPNVLRGQAWEAISAATSQADLAAIYEHFSSVWVDELTAHGQSVAANFTN